MTTEETKQVLRLSLTEFSLPKFYLLFGISKVKSAAVIAFRSSYRDRSFSPGSYERETFALSSLETVTEALLEIMEVRSPSQSTHVQVSLVYVLMSELLNHLNLTRVDGLRAGEQPSPLLRVSIKEQL